MKRRHDLIEFVTSLGLYVDVGYITKNVSFCPNSDDDYECDPTVRVQIRGAVVAECESSTLTGALRGALKNYMNDLKEKP